MTCQLIIIGGGASGLAAAVTAASFGIQRIVILEKLPRIGKKLLATGNGRCNLSHEMITAADYQGSVDVTGILTEFGDVSAFFENLGLYLRTDDAGRMYPYSMTANAVLDAFRLRLRQYDIAELCGCEVVKLYRKGTVWHVQTAEADYTAACVIFSAGGHAAPKLGTDGSAWKLLENLGIPIVSPRPILCPVLSVPNMLHPLKGLRVKGAVTLWDKNTPVCTEAGEVQFTEKTLSGICLFNLSGLIDTRRFSDYVLSLDVLPEQTAEETLARLYALQAVRYDAACEDWLTGLVQKPLGRFVLKTAGIQAVYPCAQLTDMQLVRVSEVLHRLCFPVTGTGDFAQAQATAGGVHGKALDANLGVKGYTGLYITGEAADVHAGCGGYHLHWCWASGTAAARDAAKRFHT